MSKKITQQEIAAPEKASEVAEDSEITETEQQDNNKVRKDVPKTKFFTSKKITQLAVFAALAIVMKLIGKSLTLTPTFTVTFVYLPWLICGAATGPIGGMIVGFVSDVLGNFIFGNPLIPLTMLSNTLYPAFIGLAYKLPIKNDYIKCVIGAVCSLLICTLGIGSLALYQAYGYYETMNFFEYLALFRFSQVGVFAINLGLLIALVKPLRSVGVFPKSEGTETGKRVFVFAITAAVITALAITAYVLVAVNADEISPDGSGLAVIYAMITELYIALVMLSAFIFVGRLHRIASLAVLSGFAAAICAFALTATISSPKIIIEIKYVISILSCIATIAIIAIAAVRSFGKTRSKNL